MTTFEFIDNSPEFIAYNKFIAADKVSLEYNISVVKFVVKSH